MQSLKVSFVIIGTIIGAGFASGQEIYTFFNSYGKKGLAGICASCILLGIVIYKTLNISLKTKNMDYNKFVKSNIPYKLQNNRIIVFTINNIINIFLLISFFIMVAGFASYFFQEFQIPKVYGGIIIAVLSFITFSKSIDGIVKTNTYLIPVLIILVVWLGIKQIDFDNLIFAKEVLKNKNWFLSSVLYASYNSIILIPILISLKDIIKYKNQTKIVFINVTVIMTIMSVIIYFLMQVYIEELNKIEIPIVYIAGLLGNTYKYIYGLVILIAIFTSAISAGYGFLTNCTKSKKNYITLSALICGISILVSRFSFSGLINLLYPIFGYLGIIQIILILILKKTKHFDISNI